jgi:hypothetical protein
VPDPDDIPTTVELVVPGRTPVRQRMDARPADLAAVDDLARLQVRALRLGGRIRVREASAELLALIDLAGLAEALGVEPRRQPELGEELGVQEVVQPGDQPA